MSDKDKRIATLLAQRPAPPTGDGAALHDWAMKLAEDVEAAERERCAKVCEEMGALEALEGEDEGSAAMVRVADRMADLCAAAIRKA